MAAFHSKGRAQNKGREGFDPVTGHLSSGRVVEGGGVTKIETELKNFGTHS